jgi:D-serine dehydratase
MKLDDYKALESKQQFSYFRDLNIQSAETGNLHVTLSFNQIQFNLPVNLRFDIPQRYSGGN